MLKIKTARVTNATNVVVQIPIFIVQSWGLQEEDWIDFFWDGETIELVPRKIHETPKG
jgi:hypothetical protein